METLTHSDMTDATHPDAGKRKAVAKNIRNACLDSGFFYGALVEQALREPR